MNFNKTCVNNMCKVFVLGLIISLASACERVDPEFERLLTEDYAELYKSVFERDADAILVFTSHEDEAVRVQAWRAMINTAVDEEGMDAFIESVKTANMEQAWMALSTKTLSDEQLTSLQEAWIDNPEMRKGISRVLGRAGNQGSLNFLVDQLSLIKGIDHEFESALAIGRLTIQNNLDDERKGEFISAIFSEDTDPNLSVAYLYGYYRSRKDIGEAFFNQLSEYWTDEHDELEQYMGRILMTGKPGFVLDKYPEEKARELHDQIAVELIRSSVRTEWSDAATSTLLGLLEHGNKSVVVEAINNIENNADTFRENSSLIARLVEIVESENLDNVVRLEAASAVAAISSGEEIDSLKDIANGLHASNPYHYSLWLSYLTKVESDKSFMSCEEGQSDDLFTDDQKLVFSVRALSGWWRGADDEVKNQNFSQVRTCLERLMEQDNPMVFFSLGTFLSDSLLVSETDFPLFEKTLANLTLSENLEIYQSLANTLKNRFEEEAKPLIDSLYALGNADFNRTLANQEWDVAEVEEQKTVFRTPDWSRLARLGEKPIWTLETDQGTIKMELYTLVAPVTISGIDSLTLAGDYDGIAFHRVVQNFVIQGGDVQYGLGFGGPDYTIPTEGSELQYERGMVGIASSGTDTEGSQYFMMHQWAPHLNGNYTIMGKVIEGMDIVDRITVGDKVLRARIE